MTPLTMSSGCFGCLEGKHLSTLCIRDARRATIFLPSSICFITMSSVVLTPCQHEQCPQLAMGEDITCGVCRRTLCRVHYDSDAHLCRYSKPVREAFHHFEALLNTDRGVGTVPYWRKSAVCVSSCRAHPSRLTSQTRPAVDDLDTGKLKTRAESLRPGHCCVIQEWTPDNLKALWMAQGSFFNMHLDISFDDGVTWMVRIPDYAMAFRSPPDIRKRVRHSEALTHRVLSQAGVPVPVVYDWGQGVLSKTNGKHLHASLPLIKMLTAYKRPQVYAHDLLATARTRRQ